MTEELSLQLLIAMFNNESDALQTMKAYQAAGSEQKEGVHEAVAIVKDQNGGIHYKDVGMTPAKGALGGVALGGVLGILTGGASLALGALGGLLGGLLGGKQRGEHFAEVRLNEVIAALTPGTSAIVALVEQQHLAALETALHNRQAEVFITEITADLAEQLQAHHHTTSVDWIEKLDQDNP